MDYEIQIYPPVVILARPQMGENIGAAARKNDYRWMNLGFIVHFRSGRCFWAYNLVMQ